MKKLGCIVATLGVLASLGGSASAAPQQKSVVPHVSIGASLPVGDTRNVLKDGWAIHGGATWFLGDRPFGFRLDAGADWWDARDEFLQAIDSDSISLGIQPPDDGQARAWSLSGNFLWEPWRDARVSVYFTGGVSAYYLAGEITEEGLVGGYWCDYWYCYPVVTTGDYVIRDGSSWEIGANAGLGLAFKTQGGLEVYLESTYNWTGKGDYIPVQIGVRW